MTVLDVLGDPNLLAPAFQAVESWATWRVFLAAIFGLPMDAGMLATYQRHTGRTNAPTTPAREAVGHRGETRRQVGS